MRVPKTREATVPPKTYENNCIHRECVQFGRQNLRWEAILPSTVLSQQCCEVYFTLLCFNALTSHIERCGSFQTQHKRANDHQRTFLNYDNNGHYCSQHSANRRDDYHVTHGHRRSKGAYGAMPPQFLEHIVILCFERRYPKQNSVIRLKPNILPPPNYLVWPWYCTRA